MSASTSNKSLLLRAEGELGEFQVKVTELAITQPSLKDFTTNNAVSFQCEDLHLLATWMEHTDHLILLAESDKELRENTGDISNLILRKSVIACSLGDFRSAEKFARRALGLCPTALGYFRLGCAQYCMSEFKLAIDSLAVAQTLEPSNGYIQKAMYVCMARMRSLKDRLETNSNEI